jgi:hypothetical protein
MTSGIESYRAVASITQGLASTFPGVAGLTTAVLKDYKRPVWVTPRVSSDRETSSSDPGMHRCRRSR